MPRLSNFFRPRDPEPAIPAEYRVVQRPEIESALRLILADHNGLAGDEAVLDFLQFALQRNIDVNQIWIAVAGNRIVWALLPITSPGRTMLLFTPNRLSSATPIAAAKELTEQVCRHWRGKDMHLAQFLLDPADIPVRELYIACGFDVLAELIYLQRSVRDVADVQLPAGCELVNYSPDTHALFARTILSSYEGSLDCPDLNGKRSIDDIIAGHKATGVFDPLLWHVLLENGQPRGTLILSPSLYGDSIELVYLGLVPEARRHGLGDFFMRLAARRITEHNRSELNLAVDSRNSPALRLYYRHGLKRIGSRVAMVRDLRPKPASTAEPPQIPAK